MSTRLRSAMLRGALAVASAASGSMLLSSTASAYVTSDLVNWNLTESLSFYGGGTRFQISSGANGRVRYRWLDQPSKTTVISSNSCGDGALLGEPIVTSDTNYQTTFYGGTGQCFLMRGRTASGTGSMYNHDGRVER